MQSNTEPSHQKPQQCPPQPRLQVSCFSDLRILQVHPIPPAPFTLSLGFGPSSSPILEMQRLRPTEDTQVTNSSLMPFPDMGLLARSSFSLPPRVPQKYLLSIYMLLTESPNHSVRSVICEAEVEWEQAFQDPDSEAGLEPILPNSKASPDTVLHTGSNPFLLSPTHIHRHLWCHSGSGCHSHRTVPLLPSPY